MDMTDDLLTSALDGMDDDEVDELADQEVNKVGVVVFVVVWVCAVLIVGELVSICRVTGL